MADVTPATGSAIGFVAGVILEVFGVDVPPIMWGLVGATFGLGYSKDTVSRMRAGVQVVTSAMLGSLIGLSFAKLASIDHQNTIYLLCCIGGFGAHPLMQIMLAKMAKYIDGFEK
jgi:uncharacterized membrane protein AbrB (regulator of aidB expression)